MHIVVKKRHIRGSDAYVVGIKPRRQLSFCVRSPQVYLARIARQECAVKAYLKILRLYIKREREGV